ncbi:DUF898 family protein [soil metagenome]
MEALPTESSLVVDRPEVPQASFAAADLPPSLPVAPEKETLHFSFTGSGKEYFRIWIVNLCLTIATLGIYSAWAKVRRLQYFDRNTQLAGAAFDFHGDPKAILKGRIFAVALLTVYHYAFGFSKYFGIAVLCFLLLSLPWMLRSALRFRLRNSSYRALRFGFKGSLRAAYASYFPMLLMFLLPGALISMDPTLARFVFYVFLLYLLWPLVHAAMKRYQHGNLEYRSSHSTYTVGTGKFLKVYLIAILIAFGVILLGAIAMTGTIAAVMFFNKAFAQKSGWMLGGTFGFIYVYLVFLFAGLYLQVRIYNLAWTNTSFPHFKIQSSMRVWAYIRLQAGNTILTLLSLGLYRPFAVVKVYKYRLACMAIETQGSFDQLVSSEHAGAEGAGGDSAADFLSLDLSW